MKPYPPTDQIISGAQSGKETNKVDTAKTRNLKSKSIAPRLVGKIQFKESKTLVPPIQGPKAY